jgi:transcriptional regulator with XRE-family HTH domain
MSIGKMNENQEKLEVINRHSEFLRKLRGNDLVIPNEFTIEMGKQIKKAREENGLNQSQLAEKLSRSQATISDIEKGKIDISILTLVLLATELKKPISYFLPEMSFFASLNDIHNKYEEEALTIFRDLEYEGDSDLAIKFMKLLYDHNMEQQNPDFNEPKE